MADNESNGSRAGETALVIPVPEIEPVVGEWRRRYDPSTAHGVPAHVTVVYPFLNASRIDAHVVDALNRLIGDHPAFDVRFEACGRFPDVLYLAPRPDQPVRVLTEAVAARWPEAPPYGGQFDDIVPHLTVAVGQSPAVHESIEAEPAPLLPVTARVSAVSLLAFDGTAWQERFASALRG